MTLEPYFAEIAERARQCHTIANEARGKGFDPTDRVEIPIAQNMAERVEGLISSVVPQIIGSGVTERIQELETKYGVLDWRISLIIAEEIAKGKYCKLETDQERIETGIRVGFAYITLGTVSSPLEGFTHLKIRKTRDGKNYFALHYSGPIRSAGGTNAAVSVLIADYVRTKLGYDCYDPNEEEVRRSVTEVYDYHERITNLQYLPSEREIDFLARNLPIQIDGDPSEKIEVSNYKNIPRIETNRIRNGHCLLMGECLAQKAPKLWKELATWGKEFGLDHWNFLQDFIHLQKKIKSKGAVKERGISPDYTYITDLVAGRPILTHPLRFGGFRLRYGRARNTGMSSNGIHPATMIVLDGYVAVGTQLKTERPGKSTALSSCDSIEGPTVLLDDGSIVQLDSEKEAKAVNSHIKEILYLGDMLVNYGDFFNRAHVLVPPGYCEEWWVQEVRVAAKALHGRLDTTKLAPVVDIEETRLSQLLSHPLADKPTASETLSLSKKLGVPLHPAYTYHWNALKKDEFLTLLNDLKTAKIDSVGGSVQKIVLPLTKSKRYLELVGIPHSVIQKEFVVIEKDVARVIGTMMLTDTPVGTGDKPVDMINSLGTVRIRDKSGTFIGARMGRPEKAKMRKLAGSPQVIFPVGEEGGRMRSLQSALEVGSIRAEIPFYKCISCNHKTIFSVCEKCNRKIQKIYHCKYCGEQLEKKCRKHGTNSTYRRETINIKYFFNQVLAKLKTSTYPDLIKGVRGTSNEDHISEHLMKGILRARHSVCVNKDGTTRYDMTQLGITHFRPREIGTDVEKLKELGYTLDVEGHPFTNKDQVLELKPQDVILPNCQDSTDEGAADVLFRIGNFVDETLVKLYGMKPFYNLKTSKDLIGHLVLGLAPHTSAAITGRIIGFSQTQGYYAHPLFHAAHRRDLDGDESCVMLIMDAFLNFSRKFLPAHRGATQDACLVVTSRLVPGEVDDMVFDMDIAKRYPLSFYEAALQYKYPWEIKIEQISDRLHKENESNGYGYTHDLTSMNHGITCSAYKTIPSMEDKLKGQMRLAEKIRAVDQADVARLVIEKHFLRDTRGNLRKFSTQQFRCVGCNEKFRRPPLVGKCTKCNGKLIFTVSEGFVLKYLQPSISLAEKYEVSNYLQQTLLLTKRMVEGVFGKEKEKQESLGNWFT